MNIGQALAAMRLGEEVRRSQDRVMVPPSLDWRDVTGAAAAPAAMPASAPMPTQTAPPIVYGEEQLFPYQDVVAGYAPPQEQAPYIPTPEDFAAWSSQAEYGAPPPQEAIPQYGYDTGFRELYGTPADTGSAARGPAQGEYFAPVFNLPPLPIPGAPRQEQVAQAESLPASAMMPIPRGMADVPMQEPVQPGASLAMLEQPEQPEQPAQAQAPKQTKAEQPTWKPGDVFKAKVKIGEQELDANVTEYDPRRGAVAQVTFPNGVTRTVPFKANTENFKAIQNSFKSLIPQTGRSEQYPILANVPEQTQQGTSVKQYPARYDEETNSIVYSIGDGVELPYKSAIALKPGDIEGPITEKGVPQEDYLTQIQQRSRRPIASRVEGLRKIAIGYRGGKDINTLRERITPVWTEASPSDPLGGLMFTYTDPTVSPEPMPIEDAVEMGLVPKSVAANLAKEYEAMKRITLDAANRERAALNVSAEDYDQMRLRKVEDGITYFTNQINSLQALLSPTREQQRRLASSNEKLLELENERDEIYARAGGAQNLGGGLVMTSQPSARIGRNIDTESRSGMMALLAGHTVFSPGGANTATMVPDENAWAETIRNAAIADVKDFERNVVESGLFSNAVSALEQRLSQIEQDAVAASLEQGDTLNPKEPAEYFDDPEKTTFVWTDVDPQTGYSVPRRVNMSINEAVDNFTKASNDYKEALNDMNVDSVTVGKLKTAMESAARPLSGVIKHEDLGTYSPLQVGEIWDDRQRKNVPYKPELALGKSADVWFEKPMSFGASRSVTPVVRPSAVISEPAKMDMSKQNAPGGRQTNLPPPTPAMPMFVAPDNKNVVADTGFNIFRSISGTQENYTGLTAQWNVSRAEATSSEYLARPLMQDSGSLDQNGINTYTAITKKVNDEIIKNTPEASKARKAAAEMLVNAAKQAGANIQPGASGISAKLEDLYQLARTPGVTDAQINNALMDIIKYAVGDPTALSTRSAVTNGGAQSAAMASALGGIYKGQLPGSSSKFIDNVVLSIYEAGLLFAAAGRGKSSFTIPWKGTNRTITWIYNPADGTTDTTTSILTLPGSAMLGATTAPEVLPFEKAKASDGSSESRIDPRTNPSLASADPSFSNLVVKLPNLGDNSYRDLHLFIENFADPLVNLAKNRVGQFRSGGVINLSANSSIRPASHDNVSWQNGSTESTKRYGASALILTNLLGKNRGRTSWLGGSDGNRGYIPFRTP